jgi:hypothetical protein
VARLTEAGAQATTSAVERSLRTLQRRVERALASPSKRGRRTVATATRRKIAARKRRKTVQP